MKINLKTETDKRGEISLSDILSGADFEKWVQENFIIYNNKRVPVEHLFIFLKYIKEEIKKQKDIDKPFWHKTILELEKKLEAKEEYVI